MEERLDSIISQLQKLIEISERPRVSTPLDPDILNKAIQAMRLRGKAWFPTFVQSWVCPAGMVTDLPLWLPAGMVCTNRICDLSSDFYDPDVTVTIYVDDEMITMQPITLTHAMPIDFGEYFIKHRSMLFSTTNNTATDALLTFTGTCCLLEKSFYEEWYSKIISFMFDTLSGVAHG